MLQSWNVFNCMLPNVSNLFHFKKINLIAFKQQQIGVEPYISFWSCQKNLIKIFQIEALIELITKWNWFFMRLVEWPKLAVKKCQNLTLKAQELWLKVTFQLQELFKYVWVFLWVSIFRKISLPFYKSDDKKKISEIMASI